MCIGHSDIQFNVIMHALTLAGVNLHENVHTRAEIISGPSFTTFKGHRSFPEHTKINAH